MISRSAIACFLAISASICGIWLWQISDSAAPDDAAWVQNLLTKKQEVRQHQLLDAIYPQLQSLSNSLNGTNASKITELLNLSDKTSQRGGEVIYSFDVTTDGDSHHPGELIIVVAGQSVVSARWPYGGEY